MLEMIQDAPFVTVVLLAIGVALGLAAGTLVLPASRRARRLQTEIATLREDQERYQRQVTEHFQTTAVLVGDLTSSYKAVYEHLAAGARTLSDPALSAQGFGSPRLIVDGGEQGRLPQEPIAHDADSASSASVPPASVTGAEETIGGPPDEAGPDATNATDATAPSGEGSATSERRAS